MENLLVKFEVIVVDWDSMAQFIKNSRNGLSIKLTLF